MDRFFDVFGCVFGGFVIFLGMLLVDLERLGGFQCLWEVFMVFGGVCLSWMLGDSGFRVFLGW